MSFRFRATLFSLAVTLASPLPAQTVDIQQPITSWYGALGLTLTQEQTFKPTTPTLAGAGVYLKNQSSAPQSGSVTLQVWNGNPLLGASSMLTSATGNFSLAGGGTGPGFSPTSHGWLDLFWSPVTVTPGFPYWLRVTGTTSLVAVMLEGTYVYQAGELFVTGGIFGSQYNFVGNDLVFRTFSSGPTITAPEPGTYALMAAGLAGLAVAARRRRRA